MQNPQIVETLRIKYLALINDLDEHDRQRWAATEALGHDGIITIASATGLFDRTLELPPDKAFILIGQLAQKIYSLKQN
jgi:hypothetical protein